MHRPAENNITYTFYKFKSRVVNTDHRQPLVAYTRVEETVANTKLLI